MDQKSIMLTRKRMNELASSHNKLTTLVACLLNEINYLKKDLYEARGPTDNSNTNPQQSRGGSSSDNTQQNSRSGSNNNRYPNFNELRAEEILKQLTINTSDN
jgi:hypothetical protein